MDLNTKEELLRVVSYFVLLYSATKALKKNEKALRQKKGFYKLPNWFFKWIYKLTPWNILGGGLYFTFVLVALTFAAAFTDMFLKSRLLGGFLTNDLPRSLVLLAEASAGLWLGFILGKNFWKTWDGFKISIWDFMAFTYYVGFVGLLTMALFNLQGGILAQYTSAGPMIIIPAALLGILVECSIVAWLAYEGWLRIWSMIQGKLQAFK
jgi:hypothetical protein